MIARVISVSVEDDAVPIVRAFSRDLADQLEDPAFARATEGLRGVAAIRDAQTPQAVTLHLGADGVDLKRGAAADAEVTATVHLGALGAGPVELGGAEERPELAEWVSRLLNPPEPSIAEAAARFWSALEAMSGAPTALLVVDTASGEEHRFGAEDSRAYELRGLPDVLRSVLTGRTPLVDAAFDCGVLVRGSFAELSVLAGAGYRVRYGDDASDG